MHPPCSNPACTTCKVCRSEKCKNGLNCDKEPEPLVGTAYDMLKKTKLCKACRSCGLVKCHECGELVTEDWVRKHQATNKCLDCLYPQCSNTACATCKTCHDPTCKSSDCKQMPKPLNPKELAVFNSAKDFVCQACLFPSCEKCKTEMSKRTRERKRKSEIWMNSGQQRTWICIDCETRANFHRK